MSIEINELNIRYKYRIIKRITAFESFILISSFKKYIIMKQKPNETVFINETLEPMIIEIGKVEKSIIGMIVFMFSIFFI